MLGYTDTDDLVRRLRHALEHPEETAAIARRGQERTLRDHSTLVRARTLEAAFQDLLQVT